MIIKTVTALRWKGGITNEKKYFFRKRVRKVLTTVKSRAKQGLNHEYILVNALKECVSINQMLKEPTDSFAHVQNYHG